MDLQLEVTPQTETRLRRLLAQMENGERFAQNIIRFRVEELKRGLLNLKQDLQRLETQYAMPSEAFYARFSAGQLDDSADNILWAGLYEMYCTSQQQLQELQ